MKIVKGKDRFYSPPQRAGESRMSKRDIQLRLARQAAMESALARYITIECGHYTDLETQQLYGFARPKRGLVWCEKCDDWLKVAKPPAPQQLPETPMF
jgi:hypothetical protein